MDFTWSANLITGNWYVNQYHKRCYNCKTPKINSLCLIVIVTKYLYSTTQISGALDPHQYKHRQKRKFSSVYGTEKERGQEALGGGNEEDCSTLKHPNRQSSLIEPWKSAYVEQPKGHGPRIARKLFKVRKKQGCRNSTRRAGRTTTHLSAKQRPPVPSTGTYLHSTYLHSTY